jgi:hypothetical protein
MNDTFAWLWVVLLVGMAATAVLWGCWLTDRSIGYLYAAYASTVVWFGALLVSLALLGSTRLAAVFGALLVVGLPLAFIRDKRRAERREGVTHRVDRLRGLSGEMPVR